MLTLEKIEHIVILIAVYVLTSILQIYYYSIPGENLPFIVELFLFWFCPVDTMAQFLLRLLVPLTLSLYHYYVSFYELEVFILGFILLFDILSFLYIYCTNNSHELFEDLVELDNLCLERDRNRNHFLLAEQIRDDVDSTEYIWNVDDEVM